jgi:hypothetical protein
MASPKTTPGQMSLDEALDDVRPGCTRCPSDDTMRIGEDPMDDGADLWACSGCGNEFRVVPI